MTKPRRSTLLLIALTLVVASCSPDADDSADPTAPPTSTTTSTAPPPPTTTTTTTTLPPGLQPQVLDYSLEPNNIWVHDTDLEVTMTTELVELDAEGVTLDDIGDEASSIVHTVMSGKTHTLFVPTADGSYEAIFDLKADDGTVEVTTGSTVVTETLTAADLDAEDVPMPPAVMTTRGEVGEGVSGAPGTHRLDDSLQNIIMSLGPPFSDEAVDVGDSWEFSGHELIYGPMAGTATITDEIEYGDDLAFVIEYESTFSDLPLELGLDEVAGFGGAQAEAIVEMSFSWLAPGDTMGIEVVDSTQGGTATFSPTLGIPVELKVNSSEAFVLTVDTADMAMTMDFTIESSATYSFVEQDEGASFEIANVLSQFEADPYLLADFALAPLYSYIVDDPDPDVGDSVFEVLFTTPGEVAGGFSALAVTEDYDSWVDVFVLTNGGAMRGHPTLANELIYLWTDREGREVAVSDSTAFRTTIDDREWLVWNSDTHTYILIGPRTASVSALEDIIAGQSPYMWQPGDCLEFRDFNDQLPFSPFGQYGLRHCSHGHEYEVLYSEQLADGPDEQYPDDIGERANRACGERFLEQVGVYPLESDVGLVRYLPTEEEWDRGARYIACVIFLEDAGGPVTLDSRFDTSTVQTEVVLKTGDCLANSFKVPCTDPHNAEVTVAGEYDAPMNAAYPDFADVFEELDGICEAALDEYGATEGAAEVQPFAISDMALGWEAGIRRYYCVGATLDDGWPIDTIGPLQGSWEIAPEQFDA